MLREYLTKIKNAKKHIIVAMVVCLCTVFFCGCGMPGQDTVYQYNEPKLNKDITVKKAVYSDECLKLTISYFSETNSVTCYDSDFNKIEDDFEIDYKNGVLTIRGDRAEKITGLTINGYAYKVELRYLNTEQFAALVYVDATDIGWALDAGDEDEYYTEEEKQAKKEAIEAKQRIQDENFARFEGLWECTDDSEIYLRFYVNEKGGRTLEWQHPDGNGGYITEEIAIAVIDIVAYYGGEWLEIIDNPDWGCSYGFEVSEDGKQIIDFGYDADYVFERTSQ